MSLSKYLLVEEYLSDSDSWELTAADEKVEIIRKPSRLRPSTTLTLTFSTHLSISLSKVTSYRPVIFDTVVTNHDNTFNIKTGRFTAPFKGTYVFFVTITSTERLKATLSLIHKFHPVDKAKVKNREQFIEGFNTRTMTVVLHLDKEDKVWVINATKVSDVNQMLEPYYTTFSGGLVERQNNI
ncbi:complement C1q tumor necrosis factor-related protein 6-like [Mercenaria mercenaria]|uniref:complement C1q tumor necrosis factor-related protein 6-like n=1 Tax=Mercenaria mercenaria TaxID=6596 RepID=UPI001E1DB3C1|nr:complement C1q tumor necrosis factor-related protein 6-like [Mercenaria mercenaria]